MNDIIERAIARHGGHQRWSQIAAIEVDLAFGGALLEVKGFKAPLVATVSIDTDRPRVVVAPFGGQAERGRFRPDLVWTETLGGQVSDELPDPRASFAGHVWTTKWSQLQHLYFVAYAMWDYLTIPFLFAHPGFAFETLSPHEEDREVWDPVRVTFPADIPAHCPVQTFYFAADGLLKRIDYQTDIAGGVAAHYPYDPLTFGGIVIPTRRRIVSRTEAGPKVTGRTGVYIEYSDVRIRERSAAANCSSAEPRTDTVDV